MSQKLLCEVYKSLGEEEMYLFVSREDKLSRVPEALLGRFRDPKLVTTLALTPERKLARADAADVIASVLEKGYYLQMPPGRDRLVDAPMDDIAGRNEKLPR